MKKGEYLVLVLLGLCFILAGGICVYENRNGKDVAVAEEDVKPAQTTLVKIDEDEYREKAQSH